jgi:uncharacterized membrane protein SpoIIM required for sporulation
VLASRIYLKIYQNRREESNRLLNFWKYEVPQTVARHQKVLLFSFAVFLLFYAIGFFTAVKDTEFARDVFGDGYVETTEENIANGNPFGIYQSGNSFFLMVGFFINNTLVCLINFVKGIFFGFLSLVALSKESMRFGVFHQMFYAKGFGAEFLLAVMLHGLLELSAIIISSGAGFVMGISILFPGTHRRWAAFKQGVKDGVKIVIGLVPVLLAAAFFEGFVTRHYKMPLLVNLLLLGASGFFIVWYFIIYPVRLKKKTAQAAPAAIHG